ncbi:hypothetical protein VTN02DRAFT_1348 [Thermoascus thermophilus]
MAASTVGRERLRLRTGHVTIRTAAADGPTRRCHVRSQGRGLVSLCFFLCLLYFVLSLFLFFLCLFFSLFSLLFFFLFSFFSFFLRFFFASQHGAPDAQCNGRRSPWSASALTPAALRSTSLTSRLLRLPSSSSSSSILHLPSDLIHLISSSADVPPWPPSTRSLSPPHAPDGGASDTSRITPRHPHNHDDHDDHIPSPHVVVHHAVATAWRPLLPPRRRRPPPPPSPRGSAAAVHHRGLRSPRLDRTPPRRTP